MSLGSWGNSVDLLGQALDFASFRQRLLSDNIANVETPGYRRKDVSFDAYYHTALKGKVTHPNHKAIGAKPNAVLNSMMQNSAAKNDDNNVDIELEMAELAKNLLYYRGLTRQLSQSLANLKMAISEGRR